MGRAYIEDVLCINVPGNLNTGGIVGKVEIIDCVTQYKSRWFNGPYGFVLVNAEPLPFKPYKGNLGLFDVPWGEGDGG